MSSMFFKNILIADVQKHTARYISFEKGLNVITSTENHVGKSSVIKSLYDTLGAEVHFDAHWDKDTKLTSVAIDVNGTEYQVVRFVKKFAIMKGGNLVLLGDSVTRQLAPKLAEIFDFSVYLAEKDGNKKVIQAPPAFTFMPYYIDQDKGWTDLYDSFERMDQFSKQERAKSLFFHLGLYTKARIDLQAKKDRFKDGIKELQEAEQRLFITVKALTEELDNIIPADNEEELEKYLATPKKEIEVLVKEIGRVRNLIQERNTALQQHEKQLEIIKQFQQIPILGEVERKPRHVCPQCGYEFDDELYDLVRSNYNQSNAEYLRAQIELIIKNIRVELKVQEERYVELMMKMKKQEKVYDESQNAYDAYLRHRGLKDTVRKYSLKLEENRIKQSGFENEIKDINKELQKVPNKKEIEQKYISFVKQNIISLNAWTREYEGNIKLLKSLNAQGSLLPKIILSQYNALFQTMAEMDCSVIRFPFVVDSPREKESSISSSKEILNMIARIKSLPQTILATVDYDTFGIDDGGEVNKIYLDTQFSVLNKVTYQERAEEIEGLYHLMTSEAR